MKNFDVLIAGGGPVGLLLACELGLQGVSVGVLEQLEDPHTLLKAGWMGMRHVNVSSVQALYRRGLLGQIRSTTLMTVRSEGSASVAAGEGNQAAKKAFVGHFAGIPLNPEKIHLENDPYLMDGPSMIGGMFNLEGIERVLEARAKELGVTVIRGTTVDRFEEEENEVRVFAGEQVFQGKWLVGCDGGRSFVRRAAGFEFVGTEAEFTGFTAEVEIKDPEKLAPGFNLTDHGMYAYGPGPGKISVMDFDGGAFDRSQPITLDLLQKLLRRNSGTNVTLTAVHVATSYTDRAKQAVTYRKKRILLAGDAAHIHSPLGGQGLNTGIGDAINLGWKLSAVIKGWAPDALLDTYTTERHPAAEWTLRWTRAQVNLIRPVPHSQAIASIIRDLINTQDGATYFAEKLYGLSWRYSLPGQHPLIGRVAPDFEFADGTRLGVKQQSGKAIFLDFTQSGWIGDLCSSYSGYLEYSGDVAKDTRGIQAMVIRPDGIVSWASDSLPDHAEVESALAGWGIVPG